MEAANLVPSAKSHAESEQLRQRSLNLRGPLFEFFLNDMTPEFLQSRFVYGDNQSAYHLRNTEY